MSTTSLTSGSGSLHSGSVHSIHFTHSEPPEQHSSPDPAPAPHPEVHEAHPVHDHHEVHDHDVHSHDVEFSSRASTEATVLTVNSHSEPPLSARTSDTTQTYVSRKSIDDDPQIVRICKMCGKEVNTPETKMIPTPAAWCAFVVLFFVGLWWVSWIPFFIPCKQPVKICPHCYRRMDRTPA